jgi:hypothetical protein
LVWEHRRPWSGTGARRPDSGKDNGGGDWADARDLIQAFRGHRERGQPHLDLFIARSDIGIYPVNPAQHPGKQEAVVVIRVTCERLPEFADLPAHAGPASCTSTFGFWSLKMSAAIISRPDTSKMSETTTERLMQAASRSFSTRFSSTVPDEIDPVPGQVPGAGNGACGTRPGRSICRSATLHGHTESSTSAFGRPCRCLTSPALTGHGSSTCASRR